MTIEYKDSKRIVDTATFADSYWNLHDTAQVNMGASLGNEGTGAWSHSVWHKTDSTGSVTVYAKYYSGSPDNGFFLDGTQGANGYYFVDYGESLTVASGVAPSVGNWDHIVVTRSSSGVFKIYVNGVYRATDTSTADIDLTSDFLLQARTGAQSNIADFALWQRELTASEVLTLYNTAKVDSISQTNLTHHYDFAQTGSTLTDQVGSINGTRSGATGVLTRDVDNIKPTNVQDNSILVEKDTAKRYWFESELAPTYEDDTFSSNWTSTGSKIVTGTNVIDWDGIQNGSVNGISKDLQDSDALGSGNNASDTSWVLRATYTLSNLTSPSSASNQLFIGLSDQNHSISGTSNQDGIVFYVLNDASSASNLFRISYGDGSSLNSNSQDFAETVATGTRYIELKRTATNEATCAIYSDATYETLVELETFTIPTSIIDLRYITVKMRSSSAVGGTFNGTIDDVEFYNAVTSVTPATWTLFPPFAPSRGVFCGGHDGSSAINTLDYITISTTGNATDFGDMTTVKDIPACVSSETRGVIGGGNDGAISNVIEYITVATTGNGTDFGDLTLTRNNLGGASNLTRGCFGGGDTGSDTNVIDYITIATTGNATDFGDLSQARRGVTALGSDTRGVWGGGSNALDTIDYITIATTGNATDFGNLTVARRSSSTVASETRGCFGGGSTGSNSDVIDYITIATTGNATDFGNLTVARQQLSAVTSWTRGCFGGGSAVNDTIDYITIATLGNATDFGNLTVGRTALALTGIQA